MANNLLLTDLSFSQIENLVTGLGSPAYRAKQLQHWIYRKKVASFDEMSELPLALRQALSVQTRICGITKINEAVSRDGTVKTLFSLQDEKTVESAYMPNPTVNGVARATVCVSSQVGCSVQCPFCATGQQGFERNLTPGEIIDQVMYFARRFGNGAEERISNLVFMGMGEPLANFDNLIKAIETLNSPDGFGLGARNMTISTSGLVPQIKKLSEIKLQVNLAVSLHAGKNGLRNRLVPVNNKYTLEQLIPACRDYIDATGRRISFEYILFHGINDSLVQARELVHLLAGLNCLVNLIVANKTTSGEFHSPSDETVKAFEDELIRLHVQCTVRRGRGLDIDAGCGQLRSRYLKTH
jgi:23S rRNA (adenine2503-C2)-methyltransferase